MANIEYADRLAAVNVFIVIRQGFLTPLEPSIEIDLNIQDFMLQP